MPVSVNMFKINIMIFVNNKEPLFDCNTIPEITGYFAGLCNGIITLHLECNNTQSVVNQLPKWVLNQYDVRQTTESVCISEKTIP